MKIKKKSLKDVVNILTARGKVITRAGVHDLGTRYGWWILEDNPLYNPEVGSFLEDKFEKWFAGSGATLQKGFFSISDIVRITKVNSTFLYKHMKDMKKSSLLHIGNGKGVTYINLNELLMSLPSKYKEEAVLNTERFFESTEDSYLKEQYKMN